MSVFTRVARWMGFARSSDDPTSGGNTGISIPSRGSSVTVDRALSLGLVYRAVQILAVSASQLALKEYSGNRLLDEPSALVRRPDPFTTRKAWIEETITSLALDGNAFWRRHYGLGKQIIRLEVLNPTEVYIEQAVGERPKAYHYRGQKLDPSDVTHLRLMRIPGRVRGLGPIQAAREDIRGALEARDFGSQWLTSGDALPGVLKTDQVLTPEQARQYKNLWYGRDADGKKLPDAPVVGPEVKVLGQGLEYHQLWIKPADAQFLETRQFNTTELARLFGIPASIMLAAVEGKSQTYSNIEQDWTGYARLTLMAYLTEIESALTDLLGVTSVSFNLDALLRPDTKTRHEAHASAINAGWKTPNEVRALEGLPPIAGGDVLTPRNAAKAKEPEHADA